MAWTAELVPGSVKPQAGNAQNLECVVRFINGKETHDIKTFGNAIDKAWLNSWADGIIKNFVARDAAAAKLQSVTTITPAPPQPVDAARDKFVDDWNSLQKLVRLGSADTGIAAKQAALKADVETYLASNPDAITDSRLAT